MRGEQHHLISAEPEVYGRLGDPTRERGKAKRFFRVTKTGLRQVNETRRILTELWQRLPKLTEERT